MDINVSQMLVSSLNGAKNGDDERDETRFWLSATSVNRSFQSLMRDTEPPLGPAMLCLMVENRRSRPQTFS